MCFTHIKNICCFSAAFYRQLVQQKVPESQYVLLSLALTIGMKRIQVQQCHLFECRWRCCQKVPPAPRKKNWIFIISPIELIFMMFLLWGRLCTKVGESYIDESIPDLVWSLIKYPFERAGGGIIIIIKWVRANRLLPYLCWLLKYWNTLTPVLSLPHLTSLLSLFWSGNKNNKQ